MPRHPRIALDLTLLIDLADENKSAWGNLRSFQKRSKAEIIITPVTSQALAMTTVATAYSQDIRNLAGKVLRDLEGIWGFSLLEISGAELGICERNVEVFRQRRVLPPSAVQSAHTIAEAAAHSCSYLLTHDPELLDIDQALLRRALDHCDREYLWIGTPADACRLHA